MRPGAYTATAWRTSLGAWWRAGGWRYGVGVLVACFVVSFGLTAWVTEDAFISFRVIDNALHGLGLVWNPGERVQVYTHPLWLFALLPPVAAGLAPTTASLVLSLALLLAVVGILLVLVGPRERGGLLAVASLLWSRGFVDYSSSGLENPLTHFLLLLLVGTWLRRGSGGGARTGVRLGLLTSALYLCRPDAVVLAAPIGVAWAWGVRSDWRRWALPVALSLSPIALWTLFSLFYYGSPVPNTALAKVGNGVTWSRRLAQAWQYVAWSLAHDGFTVALLVAGAALGVTSPTRRLRPLGWSLVVWFLYLAYVGADYMGSRFFSAPVLLAVLVVADALRRGTRLTTWGYALLLVAQAGALRYNFAAPTPDMAPSVDPNGVADERSNYWGNNWMVAMAFGDFGHLYQKEGAMLRDGGTFVRCTVGMAPYAAGPKTVWIDPLALADPFLARLPARDNTRVGHYERAIPPGYLASRVYGDNRLKDPTLRALYDDVRLATAAPLLAPGRWAAIWRLNTGYYKLSEAQFDRNAVRLPGFKVLDHGPWSCLGAPFRADMNFRVVARSDGNGVLVTREPFLPGHLIMKMH